MTTGTTLISATSNFPMFSPATTISAAPQSRFPLFISQSTSQPFKSITFNHFKVKPYCNTDLKPPSRRNLTTTVAVSAMLHNNPIVSDLYATALSGGIALSMLRFWEETAKHGFIDQKLNRKLVHISVGMVFMLCWPLFGDGRQAALFAALIPGVNIIKMLLLGNGIWKDEATVKSMSRFGDHRELLQGPLYYASTMMLVSAIYWRTSPISIAVFCTLCAGDGFADIVGRRYGSIKLPYNRNKSIVGSLAMATAGFLSSVMFMRYFASFGYVQESSEMVFGFLMVSLATTLVESLPISNELDDNLTIPVTSILLGILLF